MGANVVAGCIAATAFEQEGLVSAWRFFAIVASLAVLGHFEWTRRQEDSLAPTTAPQQVPPEHFADIDSQRGAAGQRDGLTHKLINWSTAA